MDKKECKCKKKAAMSTPEGVIFNKPYNTDTTMYNEHYWDTNRNLPHGNDYDIDSKKPIQNLKDIKSSIFKTQLDKITKDITDLLKNKNEAYGNSALEPANIFSKTNATDSLCARIDDKLMRIKNKGINDETEDTVDDLIGYLLLLKMSM